MAVETDSELITKMIDVEYRELGVITVLVLLAIDVCCGGTDGRTYQIICIYFFILLLLLLLFIIYFS